MKRLHCITLGLFLLTVTAKQEEFQGNLTEKTKGTTVTKDLLWKKENTIGHGTEAIPSENTHQHTAELVTTKFPRVVLFDTRQTQAYKRIQIAKASSVTALPSREHFVSRNVQNSLTLTKANPLGTMVGTNPRVSVKPSHEEIMSSAQFVLESTINDTSKPQAHLSADTVKAPPWFHALHDNRNQRKTSSVTLTSADGGLGVPILSASNPHVIDKLAVRRNNNDDKLAQSNDTPTQGGGVFLSSTMQSILQSDPAEDSLGGNTMTDLCLTCLDDGRAASTEKSVTLPALSPHGSSDSLGTEGLTLDLNQFPTSLHSLYHQPARELDKIQSKEITHRNTTKNSSFIERRTLIYNQTFLPFFFNKTVKHSISNNSQIKYLLDAETVMLDTRSLAEISSVTQEDIKKQSMHTIAQETSFTERLSSTATVLYPSSKSLYNDGEPIKNGEPDMFGKKNKNASNSLSVNLTNQDISNGPLSNLTFKAGRTNLIEAHSAITPVSLRRPTITAVKTLESHILTVKADSFISVFMAKARSKQGFQTKESISTLLSNDSATKLSSVTVTRHMTDKQDSQIFNTEHNIVKQPSVDTPVEMKKPVTTEPKMSTFATQKAVPVKFIPYESRRVLGDDVSGLTLTTLSSLPFSDKPTSISSKSIQDKIFDATRDGHVTKTHQLLTEHNNLITESQNVHKLKMGDQSEQMLTEAAETETREIIKIDNIQKTEEILNVHDEEQRMEDEIQDNKTEKLLSLDKTESGNLGNIINYEAGMNLNIDRKAEKMEEFLTTTSTEKHVTLRQGKDPRQGEKDTEREGVTKINSENSTQDTAERHSETLEAEGTEAESKEPLSVEDMKCNKDIRKGDMTNVPLEAITNLKELSRDKGHSVSNPSSCHRLIKELEPAEQDGIHLGEKTPQIEEITNNSFSYKVTSNHSAPHSILKSPRPKVSPTTSMPKEPYSQIKLHLSTHRAMLPKHGSTSPQNKKITFSLSAVPTLSHTSHIITSKFSYILKPTISQHSAATESAHPFQHSISDMLSLTTPPLAITAGILRAQPHFTVNTSLNRSIIHSITDHRHKFNTSVLRASSVLHTANEREQAEYIIPSMNPALHQQMYNDLSTKPPTVAASSEAHISIGQLQPHQGQSATQRSQSSSCYDMTSGQPCSFKLSEQASHPDALHAHADANKQRFVQTQTSSMNPKEENNQFPLSSLSPVLNPRTFGGNSLPVTYRLPRLTGSASEEKTLQASPDQENANIGSDNPLLVTAYEGNQTMQAIVMSKVKHSGTITKAMEKKTNKKHSSPFISTISVNIESEFTSMSVIQTENESNLTDVSNSDGKDEANTINTTPKQNHSSHLGSTRYKTENAIHEDFVDLRNDIEIPFLGTNGKTGTTAFERSEMPKIETSDVTNNTMDTKHHAAKTENQNHAPTQHNATNMTLFFQHVAERIMNVTSQLQIIPAKINDFSPTGSPNVSAEDYKSPLTSIEGILVTKKSSQTAVEHMVQSKRYSESFSLRESLRIPTTGKITPAVKRENTVETLSVKQPEREISVQVVKQSQHAFPIMNEASRLHNESELGIIAGFLKPGHRAGGTHSQTVVERIERMNYSSSKDIQLARTTKNAVEHPLPKNFSGAYTQDRGEIYERHMLSEKTSISQAISGAMTDSVPPARMLPVEIINKIRCSKSGEATKTTIGAAVIDHTEEMYKTNSGITGRGPLMAENPPVIKQENGNCSSESPVSIKATPQASDPKVVPSPVSSKSEHDRASVDETMSRKARNISDKTVHLERDLTPQWAELVKKTTQRRIHRETSGAHRTIATEASLSETEAATVKTRITSTEETLFSGENTKTQLDRGAGKGIFEAQNANRSIRIQAKEETAGPQSGSRLLQSEPESESELPWVNPSRRTSPHLYLSGISEVSDDLCGSGNYTAEMSLDLGSGIEPGDAVPATGSLRVVINLKTNNSQINLGVTSCCLSPTTQPDLINSTCCLFSRLAAEPAGITLLPSALSTSASFTISLFQMINYSVVYLHCDLSICLRNDSDCERQCIQQRSRVPSEGPDIIVTNLRNRISFGPMLRQVKNSTFPQEIDPSELDLVLVIVSLVIGFCLVSVMLLLVWLAYRQRAIRLLRSAAPSQACCGCVHPGGDLILP